MKNSKQSSKSLITKIISAVIVLIISVFGGKEILSDKDNMDSSSESPVSYSQTLSSDVHGDSSDSEDESTVYETPEESSYDNSEMSREESSSSSSSSSSAVEESSSEEEQIQYYFASQHLLDSHFEKHGDEFDGLYATAEEYEEGANRVINSPDAIYKTEKEDGDHLYYIEETNEFVVVSTSGSIRTYFKPTDGIDYFNRQ